MATSARRIAPAGSRAVSDGVPSRRLHRSPDNSLTRPTPPRYRPLTRCPLASCFMSFAGGLRRSSSREATLHHFAVECCSATLLALSHKYQILRLMLTRYATGIHDVPADSASATDTFWPAAGGLWQHAGPGSCRGHLCACSACTAHLCH